MSRLTLLAAAGFAALSLAACGEKSDTIAVAPEPGSPEAASTSTADASMREAQDFVNAAGQAGLVEVRTSEMALEKAKNADLKTLAQKLIDDHKAAGEKLKAVASTAALQPPPETLDDFHMRRINDLVETDGDEDFDADYAALQVDAHDDAIKLFEDYSKKANANADLKAFADETLPTLVAHKAEVERVRDLVNKIPVKNPS